MIFNRMEEERNLLAAERSKMRGERATMQRERADFTEERQRLQDDKLNLQEQLNHSNKVYITRFNIYAYIYILHIYIVMSLLR